MLLLRSLAANYDPAFTELLKYEGGWQQQKEDKGNYYNGKLVGTNLGITPNAYKAFYKTEPTVEIIKGLTPATVKPIYKKNYWDKMRGDDIANDSVAKLIFDVVVNSGTGNIKAMKAVMNSTAGKKIVAETTTPFTAEEIKLLNGLPQDIYFKNVKAVREAFYRNLVKRVPTNQKYLKGWLNRLNKHIYSGATSSGSTERNFKKYILPGVLVIAAGGAAVYLYKKRKRRMAA